MTWPRTQPTSSDFDQSCPDHWYDQPDYFLAAGSKWPTVDAGDHSLVRVEGTLTGIEISPEDSPFLHSSHDLDMTMSVDYDFGWIPLKGSPTLVLETESAGLPHIARPSPGDHICAVGRWIFDCGHSAKTEVHPLTILASDREEYRELYFGGPKRRVRVAKLWMNSNPGGFSYRFTSSPFVFSVDLPPQYASEIPFIRVVRGSAEAVAATLVGGRVQISVTPTSTVGQMYWEFMVGWLGEPGVGPGTYERDLRASYTVTLDTIDIVHSRIGRWYLDAVVNGSWIPIFRGTNVAEGGPPLTLNLAVPVIGHDLTIEMTGYHDIDPFKGDLTGGLWHLGTLASQVGVQSRLCATRGHEAGLTDLDPSCSRRDESDWVLSYTVHTAGSVEPVLPSVSYWQPRLADEPQWPWSKLGPLVVPDQGQLPVDVVHQAFLTGTGGFPDGVRVLAPDLDAYDVSFTDFADVVIGLDPSDLRHTVTPHWSEAYELPDSLRTMCGPVGYRVIVGGDATAVGDVPYRLTARVAYRALPPDPALAQDEITLDLEGGRLVDLQTPDPRTVVDGLTRTLAMDWAWQDRRGQVHTYDVRIPPLRPRLPVEPCYFDSVGALELSAPGEHLQVMETGQAADDVLVVGNLTADFPTGQMHVRIRNKAPGRSIYRLTANWTDSEYFDPEGCRARAEFFDRAAETHTPWPWPALPVDLGRGPSDGPSWRATVDRPELGPVFSIPTDSGGAELLVSSPSARSLIARLYDENNVLIAESTPVSENVPGASVPDGYTVRARIKATGLDPGLPCGLRVTAAPNSSDERTEPMRIAVTRVPADEAAFPVDEP